MDSTGSAPLPYRERLLPSVPFYLLAVLAGGAVAVLLLPFDATAAGLVGVAVAGLCGAVLVVSSPVVAVDGPAGGTAELRAGRARIPVALLGEVEALDAENLRRVMGPEADVRAWSCYRPWVRTGVRVEIVDPRDPTPYWLISTRRPDRLRAALVGASWEGGQAAHSEQIS